jgi:hypothetical protein
LLFCFFIKQFHVGVPETRVKAFWQVDSNSPKYSTMMSGVNYTADQKSYL